MKGRKKGEMISVSGFQLQYYLNLRVVDLAVEIPYYA